MLSIRRFVPALAAVTALLAAPCTAQCPLAWGSSAGFPGASGWVQAATMWDPDGGGPANPLLVVGGTITTANATAVSSIATFDPATATWGALGTPGFPINAVAVLPNGDLVAAGAWGSVERWNGTTWVPLGQPSGTIRALAVLPNGNLIAAGDFTTIGGVAASDIAAWNGTSWAPLGAGIAGGVYWDVGVHSLAVTANGDLIAGGNFTQAGGLGVGNIARWNGTSWSGLGTGVGGAVYASYVRTLLALPGGGIVAGGEFATAGGASAANIATWNGSSWAPMGSLGLHVYALRRLQSGAIVAGGSFNHGLATWNGSSWTPIPGFPGLPPSILTVTELPTGSLALGGAFSPPAYGLVLWDGSSFAPPNPGIQANAQSALVATATTLPGGDVVLGGVFTAIEGTAANSVARWDGTAWHAFGTGTDGSVACAAVLPNGDLVVGGSFSQAGGVAAANVARWNGSSWSPLGSGTNQVVQSLCVTSSGDVIAGGTFTTAGGAAAAHIARWNGAAWTPLGNGLDGPVQRIVELPGGQLVAGGSFAHSGAVPMQVAALWTGSAWTSLATFYLAPSPYNPFPIPTFGDMLVARDGALVLTGQFTTVDGVPSGGLARRAGGVWSDASGPFGGYFAQLFELPDGDLLCGGNASLVRRDPAGWTSLGAQSNWVVLAFAMGKAGELLVAGALPNYHGFVARLAATCPASATPVGAGCNGSVGPLGLLATSPPWLGGSFTAQGTGSAAGSLVLGVTGLAALALPLAQVLPQAAPGCDLLVSPDLLQVLPVVTGTATLTLPIPDTNALLGMQLRHQHVVLEIGTAGAITLVASTHALLATIGAF